MQFLRMFGRALSLLLVSCWLVALLILGMPLSSHSLTIATWHDAIVLAVRIPDSPIQQRRGTLTWTDATGRPAQVPLIALADGQQHRYVLPVGAHSAWRGTLQHVRASFPAQDAIGVTISDIRVVERPLWALDHLLLVAVAPVLPVFPSWPGAVLLVATVLGSALALSCPWGRWRQRLTIAGLVLGGTVGVWTVATQVSLLPAIIPRYAGLGEPAALAQAPTYHEPPQLGAALVAAVAQLPNGPVLVLHPDPDSYLVVRARALLVPRRVDALATRLPPAALAARVARDYVGVIAWADSAQPPVAGWQRVSAPGTTPAVWRAPGLPPWTAPVAPRSAWPWAVAAFGLVVALGWGSAGLLGWRGGGRIAAAWPLGVSLLAWWLFVLARTPLGWSWATIGLPLASASGLAAYLAWRYRPHALAGATAPWSRWDALGLGLILALVASVTVQAVLVPFGDIDTWKAWNLAAQSFALDGEVAPFLTRYSVAVLDHLTYPPAQPLLQTWGYVAIGGLNERLVKLVFPLWYAASIGLLWWGCRQWCRPPIALAWALLWATTPLVMDHATLGNADLPFAAGMLLAVLPLARWIEHGERRALAGATVALAGLAWLKLDGLYLGVGLLAAALFARWITTRRTAGMVPVHHGAAALGALLLAFAPWPIFTAALGMQAGLPGAAALAQREGGRLSTALLLLLEALLFSHSNSAWGLLGGGYGVLWFLCLGGVLGGWRHLRRDPVLWWLLLCLLGGTACYVAIYVIRPYVSIERYLLHLAPLAVLAAARATGIHVLLPLPMIRPLGVVHRAVATRKQAAPTPNATQQPAPRRPRRQR